MRGFIALSLACFTAFGCAGAPPAPPPPPRPAAPVVVPDEPNALLEAVREAYAAGQFARGLDLVKRVLEVSPDKGVAYDRVGSIYFSLGRGGDALGMWEAALALETDAERKTGLTGSVNAARRSLGLPDLPPPPPARVHKPPVRKPTKKPGRKVPVLPDREEAQAAYTQGVEKYAAGEYLAATTLFLKALDIDPTHEPARKALERLKMKPAP